MVMSGSSSAKAQVRQFWDRSPCGLIDVRNLPEGSRPFFEALEKLRYEGDDFMPRLVQFQSYAGRKVLEVGCGLGTDLIRFARSGAKVYGVDLSARSLRLASQRLEQERFGGFLMQADAEELPFKNDVFERIYSWGVLHHTPDTQKAVDELLRVCQPGGELLVMLYHVRSLVAWQVWIRYGLFRGKPWLGPRHLVARHMESPGTQAFTIREVRRLFSRTSRLQVRPMVTRYDARIGRRRFLPRWMRRFIPSGLGWFLVVRATK